MVCAQTVDSDVATVAVKATNEKSENDLPIASPTPNASTLPSLPAETNEPRAINPPQVSPNTLRHLSLTAATDLLIQNNLPTVAARYNVNLAQAQRLVAGLRPAPSVTVSATQFTFPRNFAHPGQIFNNNTENGAANTTFTIEYDRLYERGSKRLNRLTQAEYNVQASEALVRDTIRQQTFQLKQAFLTALLARENLLLANGNLKTFEKSEKILFAQVKEGYSAGVDLKRIQLQELQFQTAVTANEQTYQQSTRDVFNLIGVGDAPSLVNDVQTADFNQAAAPRLEANLDVVDGDLNIVPVVLWITDLRRMALENRPDVRAAQLNLAAAQAGLTLAESLQKRDITIGTQFSRSGSDNTFGVVTTIPLDVKRRAGLAVGQAQVGIRQAEANLRLVQTQALTDVEKAFLAYMISRDRLRLYTGTALNNAAQVRQIEQIAYNEGAKGLLDYLDAQRTYNQTLLDYNQSRFDFLSSLTQLEAAIGTNLPH